VFHDRHVEIAERVVHDAVARTCADDDKVVVVHAGSVGRCKIFCPATEPEQRGSGSVVP
jgi:hypothetical protein